MSLDDFQTSRSEYLRHHRGYSVGKPDDAEVPKGWLSGRHVLTLSVAELNSMNTLALCGRQVRHGTGLLSWCPKHISRQL